MSAPDPPFQSNEIIVVGWHDIVKYSPYSLATTRAKFGREMVEGGVLYKSRVGRGKHRAIVVWGYRNVIQTFFMHVFRRKTMQRWVLVRASRTYADSRKDQPKAENQNGTLETSAEEFA